MQKRFFSMLAIGGITVLCFAPNVVRAEDGTAQWQPGLASKVVSNIDVFTPVTAASPPMISQTQNTGPESPNTSQARYRSLVDAISRSNSVDPDLIDAMIRTESNYNPWAVSSKGARGLMQLIPETGRRFGVRNFFDPQENIEGGVRYVRYLLDMFGGNVDLSLAAYNAGENLVARLGTVPPIPETRNYVRKIRAVYTKSYSAVVPAATATMTAPPASPIEKVQEPAIVPISDRLDERGVHHFSNIELIH